MPDLREGLVEHYLALLEDAGIDCVYTLRGDTSFSLRCIKGSRRTQQAGTEYLETYTTDDFIASWADMRNGGVDDPDLGDTIVWTDDRGVLREQEVVNNSAERRWDHADQFGQYVRIHTIEVMA